MTATTALKVSLLLPCVVLASTGNEFCAFGGECLANTVDNFSGALHADECTDKHEQCEFWASIGECEMNPNYMHRQCTKVCGACAGARQLFLADGKTFGVPQSVTGSKERQVHALCNETERYMREEVMVDETYKEVREDCQNRNELCAFWAVIGECEHNPTFMQMECAPSCKTCINLDFNHRCPFDRSQPSIWGPGDLNSMFTRIVTNPDYEKYNVTVLSQPGKGSGRYKDDGPWVITLENLLTDEQCDKLIELGGAEGYQQSYDVGKKKYDGTYEKYLNKHRTSTNSWCVGDCYNNTVTREVLMKLEELTQIPDTNSEYLQMLKYEVTQKYGQHHDCIEYQRDRQPGVRILTIYMYLNDVEAGGGTNFPYLDLTVMPKKGLVLIWPSVLDAYPDYKDDRTEHQALPVEAGVKYGANAWVHQRSFKEPYARGCV